MTDAGKPPHGRLSIFYFSYFATLGILVPYWSLYLQSLGYSAKEIGELLAILVGTKLVAPYIWGWIADHTGYRVRIVQIGALLAALSFLLVYKVEGYWAMAAVMMSYSFFWNAILPQFEVVTLNHLNERRGYYGLVRSWGSIGFIMAVMLTGPLVDQYGVDIVLPLLAMVFFMLWISSLAMPSDNRPDDIHQKSIDKVLQVARQPPVLALFTICFLMQFSHGAYYVFFSIYLEDNGYSKTMIGQYWALAVLAEVIMFLFMSRLIKRFGLKKLLVASLMIAVIRWIIVAYFINSAIILMFSQSMHAATFGLYHAIAIYYIYHYFTGKLQGRGQALYSSLSFGAGGAAGSLVSGYSWEFLGSEITYIIASISVLIGAIVALLAMKEIT